MPTTPPPLPGDTIGIIRASMRCLAFSLLGLVPLLGLPFAVAAIIRSRDLNDQCGATWNPAERQLTAARALAPAALAFNIVCVVGSCLLYTHWGDLGCSSGWG